MIYLIKFKKEILYDLVFKSLIKIMFDNSMEKLQWQTIVTDRN